MARLQSTPAVYGSMERAYKAPSSGARQQVRAGMARLQSTPAVYGSMERAYKARLQWGTPAGEGGDGALTKHACSLWEYGTSLQSTPAVGHASR